MPLYPEPCPDILSAILTEYVSIRIQEKTVRFGGEMVQVQVLFPPNTELVSRCPQWVFKWATTSKGAYLLVGKPPD